MELRIDAASSGIAVSRSALAIWIGALLTTALHLAFSGIYGYQRDELYFIACAKHLAWGYVDQPPLIALVVHLSLRVFGDSLSALRIVPAAAAGALVALTGYAARRFGGSLFAVALAMIAVALAPFDLAVGSLLTMNAFEPLFWLGLTLLLVAQFDAPLPWRWPLIGMVLGVGVLNKWSIGLYALSLVAGVAVTSGRRVLYTPGLAVAFTIAVAIAAPNIGWQASHGWPQLEVLQNAEGAKNEHVTAPTFLLEQLLLMSPVSAPLWLAGLAGLARRKRYAWLAVAYVVLVGLELVLHGKVYYLAPIYPALIAAGAVAVERATRGRALVRTGLTAGVALAGAALMPLATPVLALPALLEYQHAIDVRSVKMENHPMGLVPQQFADQLGWDELERTVAAVVAGLPAGERATAAILTGDYGQAAALDFLGRRDNLPPAVSGHNQYYLWGPGGEHPTIVAVGVPRALLAREYRSIERVATYRSAYVLPQNNDLPIYVCRDPRRPLEQFWPQLRRFV